MFSRHKLNRDNLFSESKIDIFIENSKLPWRAKIFMMGRNFHDDITLLQNHDHHQIQYRMSMLRLTVRLSMVVDLKWFVIPNATDNSGTPGLLAMWSVDPWLTLWAKDGTRLWIIDIIIMKPVANFFQIRKMTKSSQ